MNEQETYHKKVIKFLEHPEFLSNLKNMDLEVSIHNLLISAHIMAVMGRSYGISSGSLHYRYNITCSATDENIKLETPTPDPSFYFYLTNKGRITNKYFTSSHRIYHKEHFYPFFSSYQTQKWLKETIMQMKSYPQYHYDFIEKGIARKLEFKKDAKNSKKEFSLLYNHIIEPIDELKSFFTSYFLDASLSQLKEPINKKIKI